MDWKFCHSARKPFGEKGHEVDGARMGKRGRLHVAWSHGRDSKGKGIFSRNLRKVFGSVIGGVLREAKKNMDDRRFGLPSAVDVRPLVARIAKGFLLFTGGASAYTSARNEFGVFNAQVDHSKGEITRRETIKGKIRVVSTQGNLKSFLRARGGTPDGHLEASVKEFQWRRNLPPHSDPFLALLQNIKGCEQP